MVLIEPETEQESREKTRVKKRIEVRREDAADLSAPEMAEEPFWPQLKEDIKETWDIFVSDMKKLFRTVQAYMTGQDLETLGMNPEKRTQFYLKKCWHHMSRNEASEAQETYSKLVDSYENLPEESMKNKYYQEVSDIYERLSQV